MDDKEKGTQTTETVYKDILGRHLDYKRATHARALPSPSSAYLLSVSVLSFFKKATVSSPLALKDTVQTGYGISKTLWRSSSWDSSGTSPTTK